MKAEYVSVALTKSSNQRERDALQSLHRQWVLIESLERDLPLKIKANRCARGKTHTCWSASALTEVTLAEEAGDCLHRQQLSCCNKAENAVCAIATLIEPMRDDLQMWREFEALVEPADRQVLSEIVRHKQQLVAALENFVKTFSN